MLALDLPEPQPVALEPEDIPLDIVYEDGDLLVINKPKGLVVHPAAGHWSGTLVNALLYHCRDSLSGINGELRPGIVHRIDKDTSGLLIVAKNDFAHQALAAQLQDHTLARTYVCLVVGGVREDSGVIDAPHWPPSHRPEENGGHREKQPPCRDPLAGAGAVPGLHPAGVQAGDRPDPPDPGPHAYRNHPIVGDTVYGRPKPELGQDSQCLHARALTFRHPRTGETMTLTCPLPDYFTRLLEALRRRT